MIPLLGVMSCASVDFACVPPYSDAIDTLSNTALIKDIDNELGDAIRDVVVANDTGCKT